MNSKKFFRFVYKMLPFVSVALFIWTFYRLAPVSVDTPVMDVYLAFFITLYSLMAAAVSWTLGNKSRYFSEGGQPLSAGPFGVTLFMGGVSFIPSTAASDAIGLLSTEGFVVALVFVAFLLLGIYVVLNDILETMYRAEYKENLRKKITEKVHVHASRFSEHNATGSLYRPGSAFAFVRSWNFNHTEQWSLKELEEANRYLDEIESLRRSSINARKTSQAKATEFAKKVRSFEKNISEK
jgi:hypothetical protein